MLELQYGERTMLFADVVESVRLIEQDEAGAIRRIRQLFVDIAHNIVPRHGGRLIERTGDGLLMELPSPVAAAQCARRIHEAAREHNLGLGADRHVNMRIGIHRADVFSDDKSLFGHGINLAARVTALAAAGETLVSATVASELTSGLDGDIQDLGDCYLKHVAAPVRLYRLGGHGPREPSPSDKPPSPEDLRPTIAVIPFSGYSDVPESLGIGDILADQVIGALSKSSSVNVISRLSTHVFRDRRASVAQIAESLSANFVVSGRFWTAQGKVTAIVELADAKNTVVLWSQTVSDEETSVLQADSALVQEIVNGVSQAIVASEVRSVRSLALPNLASHTLLLAAISLLYRLSPQDFDRAQAALEALHGRAPRHPGPMAWLARWHLFRVVQGWSEDRDKDGKIALSYANRALDADPNSSLALTMLGNVNTSFLKDLGRADALYDQALSLNPNESLAWLQKGNAHSFLGDGAGALALTEKAVSLSPLDPSRHFYQSILASAALSAGEYERAITAARASLMLNNDHVSTHRVLAIAQAMSGRMDEARATVRHILSLEPNLTASAFIARSPGAKSGLAKTFGLALHAAGLPWGEGQSP